MDNYVQKSGLLSGEKSFMNRAPFNRGALWMPQNVEMVNYVLGLTTSLSLGQKKRLDSFVTLLKTELNITNLSDFFDCMWVISGETKESSYRNLVKNAHHLTDIIAPTWIKFEGIQGNAIDQRVDTNFNPYTEGINFKQNDCCIGVKSNIENPTPRRCKIGLHDYIDTSIRSSIFTNNADDTVYTALNSGEINSGAATVYNDSLFVISRNDGSGYMLDYDKNMVMAWRRLVSGAPYNGNFHLLAENVNQNEEYPFTLSFSDDQIGFAFLGKSLTSWYQYNKIRQAYMTYLADVGKGDPIIGTDMIKNGGFDDNSVWEMVYGDWVISDGVAHRLATSSVLIQTYPYLKTGCTYKVRFTISNCASVAKIKFLTNAFNCWAEFPLFESYGYYENGTHELILHCIRDDDYRFEMESDGTVTFDLDDVSVIKLD